MTVLNQNIVLQYDYMVILLVRAEGLFSFMIRSLHGLSDYAAALTDVISSDRCILRFELVVSLQSFSARHALHG